MRSPWREGKAETEGETEGEGEAETERTSAEGRLMDLTPEGRGRRSPSAPITTAPSKSRATSSAGVRTTTASWTRPILRSSLFTIYCAYQINFLTSSIDMSGFAGSVGYEMDRTALYLGWSYAFGSQEEDVGDGLPVAEDHSILSVSIGGSFRF